MTAYEDTKNDCTVIAGAGISGIRTAFDLAELGQKVVLVDAAPSSGGILSKLDHQFPDNHCGMCMLLPMIDRDKGPQFCLRRGIFHENVTFIPSAEITDVDGAAGRLAVKIAKKHTGIDPLKCMACGACEAACPVSVPDGFNEGLGSRKAVFLPVPHQIPNHRIIDFDACTRCGDCVTACPVAAITLDGETQTLALENVNAVILATGSGRYDPSVSDLYGYGTLPNVVTATELERIMSSSGPFEGSFVRPSDKKPVKRMAWLQCVGSRNLVEHADHCSSACCMFAVKEAVLACEKGGPDLSATIFYMDMRTFGRDFQRYKDKAEQDKNLRFVRCRVHSVEPCEESDDLKIGYITPKGTFKEEIVDLVVLSTGKKPGLSHPDYYGKDGVFCVSDTFEFKDIAESLIASDVAGAKALTVSGLPKPPDTPDYDPALYHAKPRALVVVCGCNNTLDTGEVAPALKAMPQAPEILSLGQACGEDGLSAIMEAMKQSRANRLIIAACNPFLFDHKIKELAAKLDIPAWFCAALDIRGQLNGSDKKGQARSLISQIKSTVNRLCMSLPAPTVGKPVTAGALVVGGGPSGLSAAFTLASAGMPVDLVEQKGSLGGNAVNISPGKDKDRIDSLLSFVSGHPNIRIHLKSSITAHHGHAGAFRAGMVSENKYKSELEHGAVILATGGEKGTTDQYCASQHKNIYSVFDVENALEETAIDPSTLETVVMIQCAGTREEPKNYCSRVCCAKALSQAITLRSANPSCKVFVLYRDIMTYGESEKLYTRARKAGVLFVPFDKDEKPVVAIENENITVKTYDPVVQEELSLTPDLLVLSTGLVPSDTTDTAKIFSVKTTQDGFLKEANSKWRPVDSGREGIFVCGLSRAPLKAGEAMDEGTSAAMRALRILSRPHLPLPRLTARIRQSLCSRCEACIPECPYSARYVDVETGQIQVDTAACQGCGACASLCPNSTIIMGSYEEKGIMDSIEYFLND